MLQPGQRAGVRGLVVVAAQVGQRVDLAPGRRPHQLALHVVGEDRLEAGVALERRAVEVAQEALGPVVERGLGRRRGQQVDQRLDHVPAQRAGQPALHERGEPVGQVHLVAAERLVAALARQHHLHVARREL